MRSNQVRQRCVLVGINGRSSLGTVLRTAAEFAVAQGASKLIVAYVGREHLTWQHELTVSAPDLADDIAMALFPDVVEALIATSLTWELVVATGDAVKRLTELAEDKQASAIVVGAHAHGMISRARRLLVGSVPERLARVRKTPVVVVPRTE
jgi:nucleotide-binding universal stress UspA family protein